MTASFDSSTALLHATLRQFEYLLSMEDARLLISFPRLLMFLESDARLSGIVTELRAEVQRAESMYAIHDDQMCRMVSDLVAEYRGSLQELNRELDGCLGRLFGELETLEQPFSDPPRFPRDHEVSYDPSRCSDQLKLVRHWVMDGLTELRNRGKDRPEWLLELNERCVALEQAHRAKYRDFWLNGRRLAGLAYERCLGLRDDINPDLESEHDKIRYNLDESLAALNKAIFDPGSFGGDLSGQRVLRERASQLRADLKFIREELVHGIEMGRSHLALPSALRLQV